MQTIHRQRKGIGLIWAIIMIVALCAIASLAVDYGMVRLAKSQLQAAADASALAAANALPNGVSVASAEAVKYAKSNLTSDNSKPIDQNADITFGYWGDPSDLNDTSNDDIDVDVVDPDVKPVFTALGANDGRANAVRVSLQRTTARGNALPLAFARFIGVSSCDVHATATAVAYDGGVGDGFIGIKKMKIDKSSLSDSYISANGSYNASKRRSHSAVKTNNKLAFDASVSIYGDARPGPDRGPATGGMVTGSRAPLTHMLSYTPIENLPKHKAPGTSGKLEVKHKTLTLSEGTYRYDEIKIDDGATLEFTGPAVLYVEKLEVKGTILTYQNLPGNLQILGINKGEVKIGGNTSVYANIYTPQGKAEVKDNSAIFGSLIAHEFKTGQNARLHYDEKQYSQEFSAALVD
jgi:hypothetical protein